MSKSKFGIVKAHRLVQSAWFEAVNGPDAPREHDDADIEDNIAFVPRPHWYGCAFADEIDEGMANEAALAEHTAVVAEPRPLGEDECPF